MNQSWRKFKPFSRDSKWKQKNLHIFFRSWNLQDFPISPLHTRPNLDERVGTSGRSCDERLRISGSGNRRLERQRPSRDRGIQRLANPFIQRFAWSDKSDFESSRKN